MATSQRAVGVVRVSRVGDRDRDDERFVSPSEQAERIRTACERDGLELIDTLEELDVSGGAALDRRPGLHRAIEMVESGEADVVVVAYLDRLVRSLTVQAEIVSRVEQAGGAIFAVDVGQLTNGSAGQWLSGTMLGAVAEYARRVTAERTRDAKRRAVERGVPPFPNVPPGYRRTDDGRLEPHPDEARAVADAFLLRAEGATVMEVRQHLRRHGIERSFHGTQTLLGSRVVLGELRFGDHVNLESHPAIIDKATWQKVQRMRSPRGRRPSSERLLARLGVLRCGSCGSRMVVGTTNQGGKRYPFYRCDPLHDCPRRVTISADLAERVVIETVKLQLAGMRGTASLDDGLAAADRDLDMAERELDAAVRAFSGLEDVDATRDRLLELRDQRDRARDRLAELREAAVPAVAVSATGDWDKLTVDERRALIRVVVERVDVRPGRGPERLSVQLLGQ
jgi:DNA invertase Pin-like site-specific DNA recombinase